MVIKIKLSNVYLTCNVTVQMIVLNRMWSISVHFNNTVVPKWSNDHFKNLFQPGNRHNRVTGIDVKNYFVGLQDL